MYQNFYKLGKMYQQPVYIYQQITIRTLYTYINSSVYQFTEMS
jgi:hypothetical protein